MHCTGIKLVPLASGNNTHCEDSEARNSWLPTVYLRTTILTIPDLYKPPAAPVFHWKARAKAWLSLGSENTMVRGGGHVSVVCSRGSRSLLVYPVLQHHPDCVSPILSGLTAVVDGQGLGSEGF